MGRKNKVSKRRDDLAGNLLIDQKKSEETSEVRGKPDLFRSKRGFD
jgi:hypothetical protein